MKKKIKIISALLIAAFVIYNIVSLFSSPETTTIAQIDTIEVTHEFDGVVSRLEQFVTAETQEGGVLDFAVSEMEMVKKGKLLAVHYDSSIDEAKKKKLSELSRKISEITSSPNNVGALTIDPEKLEKQISQKIDEVINAAPSRDMAVVSSVKDDINMLLGRKLTSEGNTATAAEMLENLRIEKMQLEKEYGGKKLEITSPAHGIFSTRIDGLETVLTPEKASAMTVSDFETIKNKERQERTTDANVVCKLVDNSKWWLSVLADEKSAGQFEVSNYIKLRVAGDGGEIGATVEYISPSQNGKHIITFVSDDYNGYVFENRLVHVVAVKESYTGYRIPLGAIRVKNEKTGVYVRTATNTKYREIDVIYKDDKIAIAKVDNRKANSLLLYDEIVVDMKEE
ncbi:MAG: hypothetical protein IKA95_05335 [Clostridia bacterium]|nr:hypothetical protein [Clostridia bacterium]